MDEPTIGEIIRDIQADVRLLVQAQDKAVSKEAYDLQQKETERRIAALEEGRKETKRMLASAFVLPLLVILVAYALGVRA